MERTAQLMGDHLGQSRSGGLLESCHRNTGAVMIRLVIWIILYGNYDKEAPEQSLRLLYYFFQTA